jgi:hypothetical protein
MSIASTDTEIDPLAKFRGLPPKTMLTRRSHTYEKKRIEAIGVSVTRPSADGYWAKTIDDKVFHVSFTALGAGWWRIGK